MPALMWFRNDLRLSDHPALAEAATAEREVAGLFVLDPVLWVGAGVPRQVFLTRCLRALDHAMGGRLIIRQGNPASVVPEVVEELGACSVHVTESTTPAGMRRDRAVRSALAVEFVETGTPFAIDPGTIRTQQGDPYRVFTPYFRSWKAHPRASASGDVEVSWVKAPSDADEVLAPEPAEAPDLPPGGEDAGAQRLAEFIRGDASTYDRARDRPDLDSTSRLSPYLHFGCVHPRQILEHLDQSAAHEMFRSEIAWREFYGDVLYHRPETAWSAFNPKLAEIEVDTGADADDRFERWCRGETGFPIVDAGMRQLAAEGWMHNRVRMITASFLVKDLHLDWTRGARFFLDHLVDGDVASNNHGWQWVAGTGTDAAPYFRVFNPTTQSKRFDPDGVYIRRWVPELAHVGPKYVHEPSADPGGLPLGYVPPLVDHSDEREVALRRYEATKR